MTVSEMTTDYEIGATDGGRHEKHGRAAPVPPSPLTRG